MKTRLFLGTLLLFLTSPLPSVLSQGYGCEADLPYPIREDCYPEPGSSEEGCRARNCTWCSKGSPPQGIPHCFFPDFDYDYTLPGYTCEENYLPDEERIECEPDIDEYGCRMRNCTWCPTIPNTPYCYISNFKPSSVGYLMVGEPITTPSGVRVNLVKAVPATTDGKAIKSKWPGEAETLSFEAEFQSNYRLRVKITDGTPRWEVPIVINPPTGGNTNPLYDIQFKNDPHFSFQIYRKSSPVNSPPLFDSSAGPFIFSDQYLTLSWKLPTENVYGIGENEQPSFKHDFSKNRTWGLWANGQSPNFDANIYGVQPHYTVLESNGNAHAVAIINSNAQQFQMIDGGTIKYTTIGGLFDFFLFLGPTPENTVQQYTEAVGRSQLPPYWGLGFQLCKYGYDTIEAMKAVVDRTEAAGIPHDVQYGDIDIMERELDFTYSKDRFAGLPEYIKELQAKGMKFVTILDPCISSGETDYRPFDLGQEMDVWIKKADGTPAVAKVWPASPCYFPDYSLPATKEWWSLLIKEFHDVLPYDALWIDMNEPANFVDGDFYEGCEPNKLNFPPFKPQITGDLFTNTLCADHVDNTSTHYNTHSLFGWFEAEATLAGVRAGTGKRSMVISRSTFLGSGKWTTHWLGDNFSQWNNLYFSIIGMLQYNQWGMPFVGPDICGHQGTASEELCQRWQQLGAFYPFSRNHNSYASPDQDPAFYGEAVAESSRKALEIRYTLLPYLYTLFYKHVTEGGTVSRALWHEFPRDQETAGIDKQFMLGSGLIISPVLDQGAVTVDAYFPNARVYSYTNGEEVASRGQQITLDAPLDFIHVHVRGGNILPTQEPARNTELARNNPMGLIVALDDNEEATGTLFFDDGDTIDTVPKGQYFRADYLMSFGTLRSTTVMDGYPNMATKTIDTIRLFGSRGVTRVLVNGVVHSDFVSTPNGEVRVSHLGLVANTQFTVNFS